MKQATKQEFPPGWNEKKVRAVIAHYERQSEDEGAAEIETAPEAPAETWICVPTELLEVITRLIENHEQKVSPGRSRNRAKKARTSNARK